MSIVRNILTKISLRLRRIQAIRKVLRMIGIQWALYPPGHFYSPIVYVSNDVASSDITNKHQDLLGIELHTQKQLELIREMSNFYDAMDIPEYRSDSHLYYFNNPYFSYSDGIVLHLLLAYKRPQRIIEIGSGYSTACMVETIYQYKYDCNITSIDITIDRIEELIPKNRRSFLDIINAPLHDVDFSIFEELQDGDLLFVDSSHVAKAGSELNEIVFNILPRLGSGVIIHFHDIFQDFEYPQEWLDEGISFNESYLLRSFLQYNSQFKILLFMPQLQKDYSDYIEQYLPQYMKPHERYSYGKKKGQYIESILGQSLYIVKS